MKQTDQTLLEQLRITEFDVEHRKRMFQFEESDARLLREARIALDTTLDDLVSRFYETQTNIPEIALLIGDADTLGRLRAAQRRYIIDLFSGLYDLEYVNNRLRIGVVHKRIGVEPKLYLLAVHTLKRQLADALSSSISDPERLEATLDALEKLILFDISLIFDTYIRSMVSEIEISRQKSEQYARLLEDKVRERTQQLEEMARTDSLTGLLNSRDLVDILTRSLRGAERRREAVCLLYLDVNNFKEVNDTHGHQRGDEVLRAIGQAIKAVSRAEDFAFRFGGDEFCMILTNCTKDTANGHFLARLRQEITERIGSVTISAGIVQAGPDRFPDANSMITDADQRMYQVKRAKPSDLEFMPEVLRKTA